MGGEDGEFAAFMEDECYDLSSGWTGGAEPVGAFCADEWAIAEDGVQRSCNEEGRGYEGFGDILSPYLFCDPVGVMERRPKGADLSAVFLHETAESDGNMFLKGGTHDFHATIADVPFPDDDHHGVLNREGMKQQPIHYPASIVPERNDESKKDWTLTTLKDGYRQEATPLVNHSVQSEFAHNSVKRQKISKSKKVSSRTRVYANPTASNFCHTCWRRAKYNPMAICSNIHVNKCRKVICKKCFEQFDWDWDEAVAEGSAFKCTHCLDICPDGSQCYTYGKTHMKRKSLREAVFPRPSPSERPSVRQS